MAKAKKEKAPAPTAVVEENIEQTPAPEIKVENNNGSTEGLQTASSSTPAPLTLQLAKTKFNKELILHGYNAMLQAFIDFKVTQDNIPESQRKTAEARKMVTTLTNIKKKLKQPALDECAMWEDAFKSFLDPLQKALGDKDKELQDIARKAAEEKRKQDLENARKERIEKEIDDFILKQATAIANSATDTELVSIEKLIGSHSVNQSRYQEFLPVLNERLKELTPKIKEQKQIIRELEQLNKNEKAAEEKGDDQTVLDIREKKEQLESTIEENKITIQETAIHQATQPSNITVPVYAPHNVKTRRKSWDIEIVDEKKAFLAGMLVCEINKEKAKEQHGAIKDEMLKNGETSRTINGIRYFITEKY